MATQRTEMLRATESPMLKEYMIGIEQDNLIADFIIPDVTVKQATGKYPIRGKEHLYVHDSERGLRAPVKTIPSAAFTTAAFEVIEHALDNAFDKREIDAANDGGVWDLQVATAEILHASLMLEKEKQKVDILMNDANYDNSLTFTTNYLNDPAIDPIQQLSGYLNTVEQSGQPRPNVIAMGDGAYEAVRYHPKVLSRMTNSVSDATNAVLSQLLTKEGNKPVHVYVGAGFTINPYTQANTQLWTTDNIVLAYNKYAGNPDPKFTKFDSTFAKCFNLTKDFSVKTSMDKYGKIFSVAEFMTYKTYVTSSASAYLLLNTIGYTP